MPRRKSESTDSNSERQAAHDAALTALHAAGAHLVLAVGKRPITKSWQRTPATLEAVLEHAAKGGDRQIGLVPASLGLLALDFDRAPIEAAGRTLDTCVEEVEQAFGPYLASQRTASGAVHAFYRAAAVKVTKKKWAYGDAIQSRQQVILYSPERVAAALPIANGPAFPFAELMRRFPEAKKAKTKKAKGKAGGEAGPDPKGTRNDRLYKRAFDAGLRADDVLLKEAKDTARKSGLSEEEIADVAGRAWADGEACRRPQLRKTPHGLLEALQGLDIDFRFNMRSLRVEYRYNGDGEAWAESNDRRTAEIRRLISEHYHETPRGERSPGPLWYAADTYADHLNTWLAAREIDPFRAWLEELPEWDGVARIDHWIDDVWELAAGQDPELVQWAARAPLMGAVARALRPGDKLDEFPVYIGPQGCGKSTAARAMLPPEHPEWFSDTLALGDDAKAKVEAAQGRVIVEAAELAGISKADRERLKSFLSRQDDGGIRLAYRRDPETMLRRFVIIGSSNDATPLPPDPSGHRRFVVVRIETAPEGAAGVRAWWNEYRPQAWAEALHRIRAGEEARLPEALATVQAEANAGAASGDELIEDRVEQFVHGRAQPLFTIAEYLDWAETLDYPTVSAKRVSDAMASIGCRNLGMTRPGDGRKRARYWTAPPKETA